MRRAPRLYPEKGELLWRVGIRDRRGDLQYVVHVARIHLKDDEAAVLDLRRRTRIELYGRARAPGILEPREHRLHIEARLIARKCAGVQRQELDEAHWRVLDVDRVNGKDGHLACDGAGDLVLLGCVAFLEVDILFPRHEPALPHEVLDRLLEQLAKVLVVERLLDLLEPAEQLRRNHILELLIRELPDLILLVP